MNWNEAGKKLQEPFPDEAISWVPVHEREDKTRALNELQRVLQELGLCD